uniref:WGS project CAEQ00000000 data, annotated contig 2252 n=1 Tax=Trypanosoma congolense (strain IL3000) TaxID=1068625 RepID=F9WCN8_TRYCI|nr:unnamed protein product [Trypanosoma congolense IL3000]
MGSAASSDNDAISALSRSKGKATLLVNGSKREVSGSALFAIRDAHAKNTTKKKEATNRVDDEFHVADETDKVTLHILNAVKEAERLPVESGSLKLQLLHDCYPLLEQAPANRVDHLAVLVYQKEGDVLVTQGDVESAKTVYARAIQIAETCVARGEKEMYMVLKRYVLAMVGMARIWYEQERNTVGFTFANNNIQGGPSLEDSFGSSASFASSILSDSSVFSLNQEVLKSIAPKAPRRRIGPKVSAVKIPHPKVVKPTYTTEDDFVLRSQMTRELKASPCELLLLRCIEVIEIGHRRQSELLIPALVELAQIYEELHLYNRALLLVRRCLGILCVVYDYDHPWIIQLRQRADYIIRRREHWSKESSAIKIQATWKMYRAMCMLENALGRAVTRHVWVPPPPATTNCDVAFLTNFLNDLPEGVVLDGAEDGSGCRTPETGPSIPVTHGSYSVEVSPASMRRQQTFATSPNTLMVRDSRIVSASQNTNTDTTLQETPQGGVITIRTTTTHRTVTEQVVDSGNDSRGGDCVELHDGVKTMQHCSPGIRFKGVNRPQGLPFLTPNGAGANEDLCAAGSPVHSASSYLSSPGGSKRRMRVWKADQPGK